MDISLFRSIASQYQELRGVHTSTTVDVISHLIEDQILNHKLPVDLFTGCERFSRFVRELPRYTSLGSICRRVFVFGIPDIEPPALPGIEYIRLDANSALAQERFVVVNTSDFWSALLARGIESDAGTDTEQSFDGIWFYDEQVIERVSLLISQARGTFYQPIITRNYAHQSAHIAEMNRRLLGQLEQAELDSHRRLVQLSTLHQFSAILLQHQSLSCILRDTVQVLSMIFGATEAIIALNIQKQEFMIVSSAGHFSSDKQISHLGKGASARALQKGKVVAVGDVRQAGEFDPLMPTAEALLATPIKGRGKVYGVVTVGSNHVNPWNQEDKKTAIAIASMLGVIIEQKAQNSGDVVVQLRRAKLLETLIAKLRKPMARLLALHSKLTQHVQLLPVQKELMVEVETVYKEIAQELGVPRTVKSASESRAPAPPLPPPRLVSNTVKDKEDSSEGDKQEVNSHLAAAPDSVVDFVKGKG